MVKTLIRLYRGGSADIGLQRGLSRQREMMSLMTALANDFLQSTLALKSEELFDEEARKFFELYPDEESAKEVLIQALEARRQFRCKCGSTSFIRKYAATIAHCIACARPLCLTTSCVFLKNMHKPRLTLGTMHIKSRCGFYSLKRFSEVFGYAYYACSEQSIKIDSILIEHTRGLEAVEDVDSGEFLSCWNYRSSKTPPGQKLDKEQAAAIVEAQQTVDSNNESVRANVSHFSLEMQTVYENIGDVAVRFDSLLEKCALSVATLSSSLSLLELEDLIETLPGDSFVIKKSTNNNKLGASEIKPKTNLRHRRFVQSLMPVLQLRRVGSSRKHFERTIIDVWRVLTIFATNRPLNLLNICIKPTGENGPTGRDLDCPLRLRIPFVERN